ncbi:MAG: DUF2059 domain-containing protein [Pseudomonadota bacterium]
MTSRIVRTAACFLLLASAAPPAFAAEPAGAGATDRAAACAARYVDALDMEKSMREMSATMSNQMMTMLGDRLDPKAGQRLSRIVAEVMDETLVEMAPRLIADLPPIMLKVYSEAELCAMADLFDTPLGRGIIAKMPQMNGEIVAVTMKYLPDMQARMQERICRKVSCKGTPLETLRAS